MEKKEVGEAVAATVATVVGVGLLAALTHKAGVAWEIEAAEEAALAAARRQERLARLEALPASELARQLIEREERPRSSGGGHRLRARGLRTEVVNSRDEVVATTWDINEAVALLKRLDG